MEELILCCIVIVLFATALCFLSGRCDWLLPVPKKKNDTDKY